MDIEGWRKIAAAAREKGGAVTATTLRESAIDGSLAAELALEQMTTLSRLGNGMDAALAKLSELAVRLQQPEADRAQIAAEEQVARTELLRLRWEMQVVREAMGLRGVRAEIDRTWPVPPRLIHEELVR
jgi:hypothetical protein